MARTKLEIPEFAKAGIEIREFKSVYDSLEDIYMMEIRNDAESN